MKLTIVKIYLHQYYSNEISKELSLENEKNEISD
jgi:hypothetical protein